MLKPGGRLLSLDFNRPASPLSAAAYLAYLTVVGSALGWMLHRDPDTYRYIPESVRRYPGAAGVADAACARTDSTTCAIVPLIFGGFMTLHVARESGECGSGRRLERLDLPRRSASQGLSSSIRRSIMSSSVIVADGSALLDRPFVCARRGCRG